jgi:hypothetical protein
LSTKGLSNVGAITTGTAGSIVLGTSGTLSFTTYSASNVTGMASVAVVPCTTETGAITASSTVAACVFRTPNAWKIQSTRLTLNVPASTGNTTVDIRHGTTTTSSGTTGGTSIYTSPPSIAATTTSQTAAVTAGAIAGIADNTEVAIFITAAGTGALGLKVTFYYCL